MSQPGNINWWAWRYYREWACEVPNVKKNRAIKHAWHCDDPCRLKETERSYKKEETEAVLGW